MWNNLDGGPIGGATPEPSAVPKTDLDHARYDRDGWMESALTAQRRVAELEAEKSLIGERLGRAQHDRDEWRDLAIEREGFLADHARRIAEQAIEINRLRGCIATGLEVPRRG